MLAKQKRRLCLRGIPAPMLLEDVYAPPEVEERPARLLDQSTKPDLPQVGGSSSTGPEQL